MMLAYGGKKGTILRVYGAPLSTRRVWKGCNGADSIMKYQMGQDVEHEMKNSTRPL